MDKFNFYEDFKENVLQQYENCQAYKVLCNSEKFNPYKNLNCEEDIEKVPFLATTLFKKSSQLYTQLLRVSPEKLDRWTVSSSTSGDPSIVGRATSDLKQIKEFANLDKKILYANCDYTCVFYPEPEVMRKHKSEKILGAPTESYIGNILDCFSYGSNYEFLLKPTEDDFVLDIDYFANFIASHHKKNHHLSVRGSTLLLYNAVEYLKDKMSPVELGAQAIVHTGGGGWDGKKGTINTGIKIERHEFVETVSKFLGIPKENFIDTYSFTENSFPITGHYSLKHKDYLFHIPKWGRIIIRDIKTLKPLHNAGDRGFLQVLNAYGTSAFAGASVLVDDLAEIVSGTECPHCGEKSMTIKILGRVKGAEAKGCGATLNVKEGN